MFTSLIGHYSASLDAKKRCFMPAAFREALSSENANSVIVSKSPSERPGELYFFFPSQWELVMRNPAAFLKRFGVSEEDFDEEYFFGNCFELDLDEQGRILFRQDQIDEAGLGKNIVFAGVNDHGIIRNRDEYEAERQAKLLARKKKAENKGSGGRKNDRTRV